jgi:hypothetical protein
MQVTEHVLFFSYFVVVLVVFEHCYVDEKDIILIKVLKFLIFGTTLSVLKKTTNCHYVLACLLARHGSYFHTRKNKIEWSEPPDYY